VNLDENMKMALSWLKEPVVWWTFTDVLEVLAASITKKNYRPDDGNIKRLRNLDKFLPDYTVQQTIRESYSYFLP
jgi:hypothetical protein